MAAPALPCSPRLAGWCPGSEAEPPGAVSDKPQEESATPSVLNKLQKWADYEAVGSPVWPTNFIPMKTPMSLEILDNWSLAEAPRHPLTVPLLLQREAALGREVGLIIDLANHDCLYSDDVPDSVEYEHVQLIAKVLPSREAINEVERIAKSFWSEHPNKFIGVHCAYGFNRTGFVVCSYLCQACGLSVEQALDSFAAARPPGVKHEKFIRELHARYGGGSAVTPEGSVVEGSSPPGALAMDGLAAEAEILRQRCSTPAPAAEQQNQRQQQLAGPAPVLGQLQHQQQLPLQRQGSQPAAAEQEEEGEEPPHFEDAADMVRRESQHRTRRSCSLSRAGTAGSADMFPAYPALLSASESGSVPAPPPTAQPQLPPFQGGSRSRSATPSRPGSNASSRNPSRHGGSLMELTGLLAGSGIGGGSGSGEVGGLAGLSEDETAAAVAAAEAFAGSRKLLQRKSSRGGGLSLALAGGSGGGGPSHHHQQLQRSSGGNGSSPFSSGSGAAGSSPVSMSFSGGVRTTQSSMSDFAAAAVHLEGATHHRKDGTASMRRSTSIGLAKALCEDFLQNNGTPSATAPITAAAAWEEEQEERQVQQVQGSAGEGVRTGLSSFQSRPGLLPDQLAAAAAASQQVFRSGADSGAGGSGAMPGDGPCPSGDGLEDSSSRGCEGDCDCEAGWLSDSSPQRKAHPEGPSSAAAAAQAGGAPPALPPLPGLRPGQSFAAAQQQQQAQQLSQFQQQQQPGTPVTPAGSGSGCVSSLGCSLQKQHSVGGCIAGSSFPRSVSIDSDNPSLGFGMREALAHLRLGVAGAGAAADAAPDRGPQALADLFRADSHGELASLDVDEHLAAMAQSAGRESPVAKISPAGALQAGMAAPPLVLPPQLPRVMEAEATVSAEASGSSSSSSSHHCGASRRPAHLQDLQQQAARQASAAEQQQRPTQRPTCSSVPPPAPAPVRPAGAAGSSAGQPQSKQGSDAGHQKCRVM